MKICFYIGYYPDIVGGAEIQSKYLAEYLKNNNSIVYISIGHPKNEVVIDNNIKIYKLKKPIYFDFITIYFFTFLKVKKILQIENPSILYQRIFNNYTFYLSFFLKRKKIKYKLHLADEYSITFRKNFKSYIRKFIFSRLVKNNCHFITQTSTQSEMLKSLNITNYTQFPNVHPTPNILYTSNKNEIVWIGKLNSHKQVEIFISMANKLRHYNKYIFTIITKTYNNNYSKSIIKEISSCKNIKLIPNMSNEDVNDYINKYAYLLVNTSISEGFSNTFIQAWMRGVPVISLNSDPDNVIEKYGLGVYCRGNTNLQIKSVSKFIESEDFHLKTKHNCITFSNKYYSLQSRIIEFETTLNN